AEDPRPLLDTAAKLADAADAGGPDAARAADLLQATLANLSERALRAGATAGAGPQGKALDVVAELASLADGLERSSGTTRPVARWLRGKALSILLEHAALAGVPVGASLDVELPAEGSLDEAAGLADQALVRLEHLL